MVADLAGTDLARNRAHVTTSSLAPTSLGRALAALQPFLSWGGPMGAHQLRSDVVRSVLFCNDALMFLQANVTGIGDISVPHADIYAARTASLQLYPSRCVGP